MCAQCARAALPWRAVAVPRASNGDSIQAQVAQEEAVFFFATCWQGHGMDIPSAIKEEIGTDVEKRLRLGRCHRAFHEDGHIPVRPAACVAARTRSVQHNLFDPARQSLLGATLEFANRIRLAFMPSS